MTREQHELVIAIDCQKQIVASMPDSSSEKMVLESLHQALRRTLAPVTPTPQYVYSSSRAVLKRV